MKFLWLSIKEKITHTGENLRKYGKKVAWMYIESGSFEILLIDASWFLSKNRALIEIYKKECHGKWWNGKSLRNNLYPRSSWILYQNFYRTVGNLKCEGLPIIIFANCLFLGGNVSKF